MDVIHERCAGLDVHKETVVGCLRVRERWAPRPGAENEIGKDARM